MKAGEVFHIRLAPRYIVAAIRVVEQSGIVLEGASLAQHMSFAFRVLLESAMSQGLVPRYEDPFEAYAQVKQRFTRPHAAKLAAFKAIDTAEIAREIADRPEDFTAAVRQLHSHDPRKRRAEVRLAELVFKAEQDPLNLTPEETQEMEQLTKELQS